MLTTFQDAEAPEHQSRVQIWIQEYEKNRQVFVFRTPTVGTFYFLHLVTSAWIAVSFDPGKNDPFIFIRHYFKM
jgi:hypothetical protein